MTVLQNQQLNDDDLELLSAYIDNQLVAGERGALEERLRHEPNLRTALEELRGTVAVLRDLEPLRPPRSFVLDPVAFAPRPSPWFGWMRLGATLASVLLALTFAVDLVGRGGVTSTSAPIAAAPTSCNVGAQRLPGIGGARCNVGCGSRTHSRAGCRAAGPGSPTRGDRRGCCRTP
jgi:hypothetical protein